MGPIVKPCDACEGDGYELDAGGLPIDCHLCEGAGGFDADGDPADGASDDGEE